MEKWELKLLERAREIVKHGHGELNVTVAMHKQFTKIAIKAGEAWLFIVDNGGKNLTNLK